MPAVMARIRITIDCDEAYKRAFLARAQIEGLSPQELFQQLVEQYCPEDLERARKLLGEDDGPAKPKKPGKK